MNPSMHLAAAFWQRGENVLVLDLDPQASAAEWHDARAKPLPHVESVQPARLAKVIAHAREIATGILVLDTAPHSEAASLEAARCADLVLVPCQPSIMDLRAMRKTLPEGAAALPDPEMAIRGLPARPRKDIGTTSQKVWVHRASTREVETAFVSIIVPSKTDAAVGEYVIQRGRDVLKVPVELVERQRTEYLEHVPAYEPEPLAISVFMPGFAPSEGSPLYPDPSPASDPRIIQPNGFKIGLVPLSREVEAA